MPALNNASLLSSTSYTEVDVLMDDAELVYLYDGTLEGMFTAIFEAFNRKETPINIVEDKNVQQSLLHSYVLISTDLVLAERVRDGLINKLGEDNYDRIKRVFLSADPSKGGVLLRYLIYTMKRGSKACFNFANPAVAAFEDIRLRVSNEAHHLLQFVRFAQLSNGVYYSRIDPKATVVPLLMDHFAARFNVQPFIIYDGVHGMAGIFDTERWWLANADEIQLPSKTEAEDCYQSLWQTFYDTIAIEERRNPTCQRNFMPKRFWGNMCEHIPAQLRNIRPQTETPTAVVKQAGRTLPAKHDDQRVKSKSLLSVNADTTKV